MGVSDDGAQLLPFGKRMSIDKRSSFLVSGRPQIAILSLQGLPPCLGGRNRLAFGGGGPGHQRQRREQEEEARVESYCFREKFTDASSF